MTSSRNFTFVTSSPTLIFGSGSTIGSSSPFSSIIGGCNNIIGTASKNSGIFGGLSNIISTQSCQSTILAGNLNNLWCSNNSSIVGGCTNTIALVTNSVIVGGASNSSSSSDRSSIIAGCFNRLDGSNDSVILGGNCNSFERSYYYPVESSIIGGGFRNKIYGQSCGSAIIGGCSNFIKFGPYSAIIGGCCNTNCYSQNSIMLGSKFATMSLSIYSSIISGVSNISQGSCYSSIVGGCSNIICNASNRSAIIGGSGSRICLSSGSAIVGGIGLTLSNESSVVLVPRLKIATASNVSASRLLVWDTDNYVKYRDVSSIESTVVLLTDGASIATDASLGNVFYVTLGGNRTLSNPTNSTSGKRIIWRIKQDATGGRTITLGNKFRLGTDITSVVLSTAPSITDYIGAIYNAQDDVWDVIAFVKGFA